MENLIKVALGRKTPDLVLKGGNIINVYTGEIEVNDIAISDGKIAGIGQYNSDNEINVKGKYLAPGFIDAHLHIESTMLSPSHFAKAVMPWGTTTGICDPHEIANVCGEIGVDYMIEEAAKTPFDALFMVPSCVPATPFENNGATIDSVKLRELLVKCHGVGEFMNAPGVLNCDTDVLMKLKYARESGVVVDGHFPACEEKELNAYIGSGITTDHECITADEAMEKVRRGMYVLMREGSATRNVRALAKVVNNYTKRRLSFCTDDRQVHDLLTIGHINNNIKIVVEMGIDPIDAIIMATLNTAECYKLEDRGAIAPGKIADIVVINDLHSLEIESVYKRGVKVAEKGQALFNAETLQCDSIRNTVNCKKITEEDIKLKLNSDKVKVIEIEPHNVTTKEKLVKAVVKDGYFDMDNNPNLSKICVIERHKATGNIGIGLLSGYGIKNGAVAISISHDSHNIIACGDNDKDIVTAVNEIRRVGGGMTAAHDGEIYDTLELPIAGLMSDKDINYIAEKTSKLNAYAQEMLKVSSNVEPFMTLSFMSLVVIPDLKISDRGLFDYKQFKFVSIETES